MKKMESTLVNMVCVLVGVALIMGGILAYVNHMTEGPISLQAEKTLSDGIKAVMMSDNLTVTVGRGSHAEEYCREHGVPYTYADAQD